MAAAGPERLRPAAIALLGPAPGAPSCPHGPALLFVKTSQGKEEGRRFYACSACRDRKDCNFFSGKMRRLHEMIQSKASQEEEFSVRSLLLDIDFRYSQFYTEDEFCHYNMFNHHFFGGEAARETCRKFLCEENGGRVIMVTDPPFGGLVEALASSFKKLMAMWRKTEKEGHDNKEMPMFWIFPYFFESRILDFFPSFSMMDYQVDYDNHALYKHGKTGRRQSPVRIFTNLTPSMVVLPEEEGYRPDKRKRQKIRKRVKMGICKRLAMKHAIFSRRKVKNRKKKT
ncbi:hypothetical protein DUI87_09359 [Hirundo rustica rustica]|uniref:GRF-type domain-containing protein n=1 Tax=Hirundo rustica rustica TaxID=333673 RepID=A0A3M0KLY1_HIRRU|nr:hypothetical protein DUI87_09359 [Hirundo rustica rustica]